MARAKPGLVKVIPYQGQNSTAIDQLKAGQDRLDARLTALERGVRDLIDRITASDP